MLLCTLFWIVLFHFMSFLLISTHSGLQRALLLLFIYSRLPTILLFFLNLILFFLNEMQKCYTNKISLTDCEQQSLIITKSSLAECFLVYRPTRTFSYFHLFCIVSLLSSWCCLFFPAFSCFSIFSLADLLWLIPGPSSPISSSTIILVLLLLLTQPAPCLLPTFLADPCLWPKPQRFFLVSTYLSCLFYFIYLLDVCFFRILSWVSIFSLADFPWFITFPSHIRSPHTMQLHLRVALLFHLVSLHIAFLTMDSAFIPPTLAIYITTMYNMTYHMSYMFMNINIRIDLVLLYTYNSHLKIYMQINTIFNTSYRKCIWNSTKYIVQW